MHVLSFKKEWWVGDANQIYVYAEQQVLSKLWQGLHKLNTLLVLSIKHKRITFYWELWDHNGADMNLFTVSSAYNVHIIM